MTASVGSFAQAGTLGVTLEPAKDDFTSSEGSLAVVAADQEAPILSRTLASTIRTRSYFGAAILVELYPPKSVAGLLRLSAVEVNPSGHPTRRELPLDFLNSRLLQCGVEDSFGHARRPASAPGSFPSAQISCHKFLECTAGKCCIAKAARNSGPVRVKCGPWRGPQPTVKKPRNRTKLLQRSAGSQRLRRLNPLRMVRGS